MKTLKIATVVGARPQFIKTAPVSEQLKSAGIDEILIHTGQHFDSNMSELFFEEMKLKKPDYNLNINNLPHAALTGRIMEELEKILLSEKPDAVLVYGDTDSTLAGAITAKKLNINLIHIEAGLRSYNNQMPEEINRILTDRISDILFCPSDNAIENLSKEGIDSKKIVLSGDVMKDTMLQFSPMMKKPKANLPEKFILCTFHRAENIGSPVKLQGLISALETICREIPVVCPLHPHTRKKLIEYGIPISKTSINFIEPVGYLEMLYLLNHCTMVLTDSGGLQKEAFFSNKYCITLREETEWTELVEKRCNFLTGCVPEKIITTTRECITKSFPKNHNLYGDGRAAVVIVNEIISRFQKNKL